MLRTGILFSIVIVVYDAIAAIIARSVGVAYNSFLVLALVLFLFMGVYAGRRRGSWSAIVAVAIAAAADATLGWYVAAIVGPGYVPGWTVRGLIVMAVESVVLATAIGAAGVCVGLAVAGRRHEFF
ncbi:MAG: hypothetical protein JO347_04385 [Candidatus Eremiobacteraeota bacterium]|nr:hypothetical protein [Candidatus Eremiobacteraeota bacterium]